MADTADALPPARAAPEPEPCFPSLAASAPSAAAALGCMSSSPNGAQPMSPLLCGRRMFLAAIVVASKFLQDQTYSNRTWSKISGLAPREIEQLERIFLQTIQYDLVVDAAQWSRWTQELSSNWVRSKPLRPAGADALRPATATEVRKAAPDPRLHRAISENVIGQTFPFDAGILQSDRNRHTRAAFVHFTSIGRIATLFPRKYSVVRPILLVPIFVTIDIASLVVQGVGAASAATAENEHDSHNGSMVVVGGVSVQLAGYLLFNMAFLSFWYRVRKDSPPLYLKLRSFMAAVFLSSLFIVLRSIYRVIEMAYGWDGAINTTEWAVYVFDGAFVLIAVVILNVYNPMQYLPKNFSWKFNPERDGPTDMESAVPGDRHASNSTSQEKSGMDVPHTGVEDGASMHGQLGPKQDGINEIGGPGTGAHAPKDM
ncbi:hypothetical protein MBRA1_001000 [Malassezia brasiliensis]|uniref:Uncharacterized protein n=1 Tax=Malassezia brasiliensis TaxID=1821822 RepID=A0AAF0DQS8_9BASI|nr:hypothetical protein MBRA1_001000 [Malassezia brasiliensis]